MSLKEITVHGENGGFKLGCQSWIAASTKIVIAQLRIAGWPLCYGTSLSKTICPAWPRTYLHYVIMELFFAQRSVFCLKLEMLYSISWCSYWLYVNDINRDLCKRYRENVVICVVVSTPYTNAIIFLLLPKLFN